MRNLRATVWVAAWAWIISGCSSASGGPGDMNGNSSSSGGNGSGADSSTAGSGSASSDSDAASSGSGSALEDDSGTLNEADDAGFDSTPPDASPPLTFDSVEAIETYLNGKHWLMAGSDIASDPIGYSQDVVYSNMDLCFNEVELQTNFPGNWTALYVYAVLSGASGVGSTGTCENDTPTGSSLMGSSPAPVISNVQGNGACFDLNIGLSSGNQGRGSISPDGTVLSVEDYLNGQATGDTCADGPVGSETVILNGEPFTGNAVQVYVLQ